jgi:hypothetical protein
MVTARLATGAAINDVSDVAALMAAGVSHIIDCRAEFDDGPLLASTGLTYLWNPTDDDGGQKPSSWWLASLQFAQGAYASSWKTCVYAHCVPSDVLVGAPTPVPIQDAGEVTGHDGAVHKVITHMSRPYKGELAVIETTGTLPLRLTPEHPVLVVRPYRWPNGKAAKPGTPTWHRVATYIEHYRSQPQWVEAGCVEPGDYLAAPVPRPVGEAIEIPWPARGVNSKKLQPLEPCADHAWMLGLYVADGGTGGQNGVSFVLSDREHVVRLCRIWTELGVKPILVERERYTRVIVTSRAASQALGGWCGKSDTKRLPRFVFDGWPLEAVLEGYVAGDGHLDKHGNVTATTISPVLAEQLRAALLMTGESPTVRKLRRYSGYRNACQAYAVRWAPAATQRHTAWWRGLYLMPVKRIGSEPYEGLVHNLEVQDAHTYTLGGATVHNCAAGVNRGPSTCYAILRACFGLSPQQARDMIVAVRPQVGLLYAGQFDSAWPLA